MKPQRKPIGQILKELELISEGEIQEALSIQREEGGSIGKILVEHGFIAQDDMLFALAAQSGMEAIPLENMELDEQATSQITAQQARLYKIIPVKWDEKKRQLTVAMADPLNIGMLDELKFMLNCEILGAFSSPDAVDAAIEKHYGTEEEEFQRLYNEVAGDSDLATLVDQGDGQHADIGAIEAQANLAPVVKLLNLILLTAIKDQASDIHLEPFDGEFKIRYRVDGVLYEMQSPPPHLASALISRVKVMSRLNISETRLPQDGRIQLRIGGKPVDLRVSTLPTMFGESVVMRILDRSVVALDLENIGLRDEELTIMRNLIQMPNGIVLVTGPTGSGKTTTLYGALNEANTEDIKIITTEDPVEYSIDGLVQIEINEEIGVTFATCLRSILRQDPDVILVGEIRDLETAEIAVEASLTGHVVFSTLHTNDAPSAITRLLDLGLEPFKIVACLKAIIAQRLVRKVCTKCREFYEPTMEDLIQLGLDPSEVEGKKFAFGRGCDDCNKTGYKGRMAIFEIMMISDKVSNLVMDLASTAAIAEVANEEGMRPLRHSGLLAIFDGVTSVEEVVAATIAS